MASVMLRNLGITVEATEIDDLSTDQALEHAGLLYDQGVRFDQAHVDRFDGLVLIGRTPEKSFHYRTPLCGYNGTGPMTTAIILELFGFGDRSEILNRISTGDDRAKASFDR